MTKRRRGRGEGTIYQRPSGIWAAMVSAGRDADGKRIRRSISGKTELEVQGVRLSGIRMADDVIYFEVGPAR